MKVRIALALACLFLVGLANAQELKKYTMKGQIVSVDKYNKKFTIQIGEKTDEDGDSKPVLQVFPFVGNAKIKVDGKDGDQKAIKKGVWVEVTYTIGVARERVTRGLAIDTEHFSRIEADREAKRKEATDRAEGTLKIGEFKVGLKGRFFQQDDSSYFEVVSIRDPMTTVVKSVSWSHLESVANGKGRTDVQVPGRGGRGSRSSESDYFLVRSLPNKGLADGAKIPLLGTFQVKGTVKVGEVTMYAIEPVPAEEKASTKK